MTTLSASLTNMSVATDASPGNAGLLMPKLQYRFRVSFINIAGATDSSALTKQVIDCTRPQVSFGEIVLPVYNSTLYLAGRHEWQPLTINIRDDAGSAVANLVGKQLQRQLDFAEQASAGAGVDYKFQTNIEILDGGNGASAPIVLETWQCYGCFIQQANYNTLNYGTNDVVQIALTIRFDNAIQSDLTSGVGASLGAVTRTLATANAPVSGVGGTPA